MTLSPRAAGPLLLALLLASAGCSPKPTAIVPQRRRRPRLVRGRHRRGRTRLRPRPRPHRRLLHAADHGFRRRSSTPRRRRPARPLPAPERRAGIEVRQPPLPLQKDGKFKDVTRRLRASDVAGCEHGRGHRRRQQRRPARRAGHPVRRHQALPQQRRRQVQGRDRRGRPRATRAGPRPPPSSTTTATAGSTSSSSITSITTQGLPVAAQGEKDYCGPNDVPRHRAASCSTTSDQTGRSAALRGRELRRRDSAGCRGRAWACLRRLRRRRLAGHFRRPTTASPTACGSTRHDGTFKEEAASRGVAYNGDGQGPGRHGRRPRRRGRRRPVRPVRHPPRSETNTLWKQGPRGLFRDRTVDSGLTTGRWRGTGFGALLADFDLDGALDLAVVNGRTSAAGAGPTTRASASGRPTPSATSSSPTTAPAVSATFRRPIKPFADTANVGRGLACGDFDGDGAPDLLATSIGGRARLFRNVAPNRGHWLEVRAFDPEHHRDAYGAEVRVRAGGRELAAAGQPRRRATCAATRRWPCSDWARRRRWIRSRCAGRTASGRSSTAATPIGPSRSANGRTPRHDASATRPEAAAPEAVTPAEPAHHSPLSQARQRLQLLYREAFRAPSLRSVWNGMKTAREAAPRPSYGV